MPLALIGSVRVKTVRCEMMELSQRALGSICLPRGKGRVRRRKIVDWVLPGIESKRPREKLAMSRGGNGVEIVAAAHGQEGSGRREPAISRGAGEGLKVSPATTTTRSSICLVAVFLLEDVTLTVRMFRVKSLIQSQDVEFPARAEALSIFCCHHKELPPVLNIFSAGEKDLKK